MAIPDPPKAGSPFCALWTGGWNPKTPKINNFFIPEITLRGGYMPDAQRVADALCCRQHRSSTPNSESGLVDGHEYVSVRVELQAFEDFVGDLSRPCSAGQHLHGESGRLNVVSAHRGVRGRNAASSIPTGCTEDRPESRLHRVLDERLHLL